jgi:DNA polymerase III epsilon subunit-like protein
MSSFATARRALVFDTETTGFPRRGAPVDMQPHVLQIAFVVYDVLERAVVSVYSEYIRIAPDVEIPEESARIHGITRAITNTGVSIESALLSLYEEYERCDAIVGHNVAFDVDIMRIEVTRCREVLERLRPGSEKMFTYPMPPTYCTMRAGTDVCRLPRGGGGSGYKFPKLAELYRFFFDKEMEGAHDALADVRACMECFAALIDRQTASGGDYPRLTPTPSPETSPTRPPPS